MIKAGDILAKREGVKEFNLKELEVESSTTARQMLEQYKVIDVLAQNLYPRSFNRGSDIVYGLCWY